MSICLRSAAASAVRCQFVKVVVAAAVVAVAGGPGALAPAAAAARTAAAPRAALAPAGSEPAVWGVTSDVSVDSSYASAAVDPVTGYVYVVSPITWTVSAVSERTGKVTAVITVNGVESDSAGVAVNPVTDVIYVADGNGIVVISGRTDKITATIAGPVATSAIAVDPVTDTIYVASHNTVQVIDGRTNAITATISVGNSPGGIAVDPQAGTVYVSNFSDNTVSVIDAATNAVTATIGVGWGPARVAVNPQTDTIYVVNRFDRTMSVIDGRTSTVTATVKVEGTPFGIAADPRADIIYITTPDGYLQIFSSRTSKLLARVATGAGNIGSDVAVDSRTGTSYVTSAGDTSTAVITSCTSRTVLSPGTPCAKIAAGFQPAAASFASPAQGVVLGSVACTAPSSGCYAVLMATADGGKHWHFLHPPPGGQVGLPQNYPYPWVSRVLFTRPGDIWLYGPQLWHSSNGGVTWHQSRLGEAVHDVAASAGTVYAAITLPTGPAGLFSSPVSATAWTRVGTIAADVTGLAVSGNAVWFTGQTKLWAAADGIHWHRYPARCPGTGDRLAGVTAASPTHVTFLCAGPPGPGGAVAKEILTSTDGGKTVHLTGRAPAMGTPQEFAGPAADPAQLAIAAATPATGNWLSHSADGGRTWTTLAIPHASGQPASSLSYTSPGTGWIIIGTAGDNVIDNLLTTTNGGRTWHKITF